LAGGVRCGGGRSGRVLKPAGRLALVIVVAAVGVCVVAVIGTVVFFYLNGGMWPGTHSNPGHILH